MEEGGDVTFKKKKRREIQSGEKKHLGKKKPWGGGIAALKRTAGEEIKRGSTYLLRRLKRQTLKWHKVIGRKGEGEDLAINMVGRGGEGRRGLLRKRGKAHFKKRPPRRTTRGRNGGSQESAGGRGGRGWVDMTHVESKHDIRVSLI